MVYLSDSVWGSLSSSLMVSVNVSDVTRGSSVVHVNLMTSSPSNSSSSMILYCGTERDKNWCVYGP